MKNEIYAMIAEVLGETPEDVQTSKDDRNAWDSMKRVEVLFAIEDTYGIMFEEEELADLITPAALCEAVVEKLEKK